MGPLAVPVSTVRPRVPTRTLGGVFPKLKSDPSKDMGFNPRDRLIKKFLDGRTMAKTRVKFSSQIDPDLFKRAKKVADEEGLQFQSLLEKALRDYIEYRGTSIPKPAVLRAIAETLAEHEELLAKLSK
jgi:hypothetical protein